MKALGIMQLVAVLAWSFSATEAVALTITHNGVGTGGVVTDALGQVNVALIDLDYASPARRSRPSAMYSPPEMTPAWRRTGWAGRRTTRTICGFSPRSTRRSSGSGW